MKTTKVDGKMKKYQVKTNSDGIGYYVVEMIGNMEMYIKGVSLVRQEMIDLAEKLNKEDTE
jgi:hypothetical protein